MASHSARPLKIGLFLPTQERSVAGSTPRWGDVKAVARHAEAAGFDSLWVPDHMMFPFGDPGERMYGGWETWSMLSALAAVTSRIELGTLVACTAIRNPALLARTANAVDEVSEGRLILGLGAGNREADFLTFGYPVDHRLGRFEEALQIIHGLFHDGTIDFQGRYYTIRDCELRPRGPRSGGPPILIGAAPNRPRSLRLTAQYADYWNIFAVNSAENFAQMRNAVDAACVKAGREPATLKRTVGILVDMPGAEDSKVGAGYKAFRAVRRPARGTPEALAQHLGTFAREGVSHVQVLLEPNTLDGIDAFSRVLELLGKT